jgi:uncharacterized protein YxjI
MEIDINQKKISIGDKYKIFVEGQSTYSARRSLYFFLPTIKLFEDSNSDFAKIIIRQKFFFLRAAYIISRWDKKNFAFKAKSIWSSYYQCQCESDMYEICGHDGRKYSIYKNNVQVAWWAKQAVTWFAGDNYKITADKDRDLDLIIAFCLIIDNLIYPKGGNIVSYDIGAIGVEEKEFDTNWHPK